MRRYSLFYQSRILYPQVYFLMQADIFGVGVSTEHRVLTTELSVVLCLSRGVITPRVEYFWHGTKSARVFVTQNVNQSLNVLFICGIHTSIIFIFGDAWNSFLCKCKKN